MGKLLRLAEVAERLGLALGTVRNWASAGKLPVVHVGGSVRVPEDELDKWVAARYVPPRGEKG